MKTLTIDGVEYVLTPKCDKAEKDGIKYCIVRCRDAGVHSGFVVRREGREVELTQSRRLWRWHGRTLSGVALEGPDDKTKCKLGPVLPSITLLDACEIIPCTTLAMELIESVEDWVND